MDSREANCCEYPRPVEFRLGLSMVRGTADLFDPVLPHVLRVCIAPRPWYGFLRSVVSWLPLRLQGVMKRWFPGPFLPPCVVVKQLVKPGHDSYTELYENEISMYKRLLPLQGTTIPAYYGEGVCEGKPAFVLSVVDGVVARKQDKASRITVDEFQRRLESAAAEMKRCGVVYDDLKLDHLILVDDRMVILDLEYARAPATLKDVAEQTGYLVSDFVNEYKRHLRIVQKNEEDEEKQHEQHERRQRRQQSLER